MYHLFKCKICKSLNFMGDESLVKVQAALGVIFNLFSKPSFVLFGPVCHKLFNTQRCLLMPQSN